MRPRSPRLVLLVLALSSLTFAQQFKRPVAYRTGKPAPNGVAVGDVNGDGIPDVVVSNSGVNGTIAVLLGNGDGTLQPAVTYPAGSFPMFLLLADFNRDGCLDIAVVDRAIGTPGEVSILLGHCDGTFAPFVSYGPFVDAFSLAVADFDSDGLLDLAVADTASGSLLLGNGDGTFRSGGSMGGTNVVAFAVTDFNHDHNADLAMACNLCSIVQLYTGDGHGAFTFFSSYATDTPPIALAAKDFNGDGIPDIAIAGEAVNNLGSNMTVLESGVGGYITRQYNYGKEPRSIAAADFNGDGRNDIVDSNEFDGTVDVFINGGKGNFRVPIVLKDGAPTSAYMTVGDLNGDGKPDIVVTDGIYNVRVLLQR